MKKKVTKGKNTSIVNKSEEWIQALDMNNLQTQIEQLKNEVQYLRSQLTTYTGVGEPIVVKQLPLEEFKFTAKNLIGYAIKTYFLEKIESARDYVGNETEILQTVLSKLDFKYFAVEVGYYVDKEGRDLKDLYVVRVLAYENCPWKNSNHKELDCWTRNWDYKGSYTSFKPYAIPSSLIDLDDCANTIVKLDDDCVFVSVKAETQSSYKG